MKTTQEISEATLQKATETIEELEKEVSLIKLRNSDSLANEEVNRHVAHYVDFVSNEMLTTVGSCEPLYNVLTSTLHIFSYKVGSPIGAYWFSLNFLLFLLYPIVITAIVTLRLQ